MRALIDSIALVVHTTRRISTPKFRNGTNTAHAVFQNGRFTPRVHLGPGDWLVVTHPFHPLRGWRVAVVRAVRRRGGLVFICAAGDGVTVTLPQSWTDRGPAPGGHRLAPEGLEALAELVDALMRRSEQGFSGESGSCQGGDGSGVGVEDDDDGTDPGVVGAGSGDRREHARERDGRGGGGR